jgi:aminoglycoside phosphotransferase
MWERVTSGQSGAAMFRGRGLYRKITPDAETEAATMSWLRAHGLPVAEVVDIGPDWIVTREITGMTAADPWPEGRRSRVIDALADMTLALHALPVDECPFDRSLATVAQEAREAAASGRVDLGDLDEERQGWTASQLLGALDAQVPAMSEREVLAVTHGDWCPPNVVLDPETVRVAGLLDTGRVGRADRYTDLALMNRSLRSGQLNPQYGNELADHYLNRCGHHAADDDKLGFYALVDEFF